MSRARVRPTAALAATVAAMLLGACAPPPLPPGPALAVPATAPQVELFVIGDSMAAYMGNPGRPGPLGTPVAVPGGPGHVAGSPGFSDAGLIADELRSNGVDVVEVHYHAHNGTSMADWSDGDPCAWAGDVCGDGYADQVVAAVASAQHTPLVVLSLGGIDLFVGGDHQTVLDPGDRAGVAARLDQVEAQLGAFVDRLVAANPSVDIVLPGAATFNMQATSVFGIPCSVVALTVYAGLPLDRLANEPINSLFTGGSTTWEPRGLAGVMADVAARPHVHHRPHWTVNAAPGAPEAWAPSLPANVAIDCLHPSLVGTQRLVDAFVATWMADSPAI